jgi:hypothetical protein
MGIDCSNCRCTNRDDEKILIIENSTEKFTSAKIDSRKERLKTIEKLKTPNNKINLNELYTAFPDLNKNIIKLQSLIRKHKDRKIYKTIVKKFRVNLNIDS